MQDSRLIAFRPATGRHHDCRFVTMREVVNLGSGDDGKSALIEYLKSL